VTDAPTFDQMERGLGRIQQHDPRSLNFPIPMGSAEVPIRPPRNVTHRFYGGVRDQLNIGACTYFSVGDYYSAAPFYRGAEKHLFTQEACFRGYSRVTEVDTFPGKWYFDGFNPDGTVRGRGEDTGSSSGGMWRALKEAGLASRVEWAFGVEHLLDALIDTPICIGIPWRSAMFTPDRDGMVHYIGDVVGGHEITIMRCRVDTRRVLIPNHWGPDWGVRGWFSMTWDDLGQALADGGDAARFYR
jgi:hypothetical protein